MPRISTHLHLGKILLSKYEVENKESFLLGCVYPDVKERMMERHYKQNITDFCDLEAFKIQNTLDDFNFGYYFHLWVDNEIRKVDVSDISKDDCLICDMEEIISLIYELKQLSFVGKEKEAMDLINTLENEPMPLYLVRRDIKEKYSNILFELVNGFLVEISEKECL